MILEILPSPVLRKTITSAPKWHCYSSTCITIKVISNIRAIPRIKSPLPPDLALGKGGDLIVRGDLILGIVLIP